MPATSAYWKFILEDIKQKVTASQFQTWFLNLSFIKTQNSGKKVVLQLPSKFNKEHIEKKFKNQLLESLNKYYPKVVQLDFVIKASTNHVLDNITTNSSKPLSKENQSTKELKSKENVEEVSLSENREKKPRASKKEGAATQEIFNNLLSEKEQDETNKIYSVLPKRNIHNLNTKFSLDSLVVTSYNELAVSVAKSIIKQPGTLYNPVFIHSGTGLGKTHLLQAVGHKILEIYPSFNIRYTTTETFLNHYTTCMQKGKGSEFHDYYRSIDLLLIDDIQFIAGKASTQETFFHTFNELHQQNKQIIITSDRSPKSLGGVEDRLISRFEWGMVLDLSQPTLEDRIAIINDKIQRMRLPLDNNQIMQIAQVVQTNIRDLEGILNQVQARLALQPGQVIDQAFLDRLLQPFMGVINEGMMQFSYRVPRNPSSVNLGLNKSSESIKDTRKSYSKMFDAIGQEYNVTKDQILSKRRDRNTSIARQISMFILYKKYNLTLSRIGKILGNRNHTTIMHGFRKIELDYQNNSEGLRKKVDNLLVRV